MFCINVLGVNQKEKKGNFLFLFFSFFFGWGLFVGERCFSVVVFRVFCLWRKDFSVGGWWCIGLEDYDRWRKRFSCW